MRKRYLIFLFFTVFIVKNAIGQEPRRLYDEKSCTEIMIGITNLESLKQGLFGEIYNTEYSNYNLNTSVIQQLDSLISLSKTENNSFFSAKIIIGMWCGDSKEQLPRFIKVCEKFSFLTDDITYICVDRLFKADNFDISNLKIEKVPTFIIYKNNIEIGRIIETPIISFEKDLLKIINSK